MLIGISGAMQEEIQFLSESMKISETKTIGMREFYIGELFGKDVVLVFSRYGKVAAASTVTTLIEVFKVDLVVFTGVAGGAEKTLNIGDIVIADKLVQHDMDASALPGFRKFEIPLLGIEAFEVPEKIITLAKQSALHYISENMKADVSKSDLEEFNITTPNVVVGTVASGDIFVADSQKVQSLRNEIQNLMCIEMEGAAVAQVCYEHNVDFIVFRVISDKADEEATINFPKFKKNAASHFTSGIIKRFIKSVTLD
ncbi:5'-methylthioadenosine/adenosylhomocysteine nucleosidase [Ruminiclostridium herbifermentans]|uniref:adenosylhomocysteine nucleosidase n=1 Tax=Ruminiclostridium herbifermentans TaxID=2488810 RepID=A0A4U7JJR1_9FIRM|nr:5'-methylthioadenosine/adenosylhomocysteine nucleosidase [Ruminiclostridium herbifermentans]QNU68278.1 5'-methylthioadenosine/adenosylhomocysteine nucleosidase [Ruminiclostridium herbifermentans]